MAKKHVEELAKMLAQKVKMMSMGGGVEEDDDDMETPLSLQEKGDYSPESMGGSDELAEALKMQMAHMAMGGMVEPELKEHTSDVEPGEPETVPTRTPESLVSSSDLTEAARKAIMDKKKRRMAGMGRVS